MGGKLWSTRSGWVSKSKIRSREKSSLGRNHTVQGIWEKSDLQSEASEESWRDFFFFRLKKTASDLDFSQATLLC